MFSIKYQFVTEYLLHFLSSSFHRLDNKLQITVSLGLDKLLTGIVLWRTVHYCTVSYNKVQYSKVQYSTVLGVL